MIPTDLTYELKKRAFVGRQGDYFAIQCVDHEKSGAADRYARELAIETFVEISAMRNLESVAWSTDSIADILTYIRIRQGRDRDMKKQAWAKKDVGSRLAESLEELPRTPQFKSFIRENKREGDTEAIRLLHLDLCREFIKHLTGLFEYYRRR